jgi:hypothetical protein
MAAAYAQDAVDLVAYDLHQFMGPMGLTLEHPLYHWTLSRQTLEVRSRWGIGALPRTGVCRLGMSIGGLPCPGVQAAPEIARLNRL